MAVATSEQLRAKSCRPCEGDVPTVPRAEAERMLRDLDGWKLAQEGQVIRREWVVKDFSAGLEFLNTVGDLAEREDHHPDLHLTGYKRVAIELSTHAIGGLSENDFILAAKINALPVRKKE
jgi:4a-hydroxytetrahydrobiopterin dehydratase